jgi:hypothetical protein
MPDPDPKVACRRDCERTPFVVKTVDPEKQQSRDSINKPSEALVISTEATPKARRSGEIPFKHEIQESDSSTPHPR